MAEAAQDSLPLPPRPPRAPFASGIADGPGVSAAPKSAPVSAEERMMILRMLEERKISVAQAEELLAAMDGVSQA